MFRPNLSIWRTTIIIGLSATVYVGATGIGMAVAGDEGFLYGGLGGMFLAVVILGRGVTTASWFEIVPFAALLAAVTFGKPLVLGND